MVSALLLEDVQYLLSRGYSEELLRQEVLLSLEEGISQVEGVRVYVGSPSVGFLVHSMSGELSGVHTASREKHDYRWYQAPGKAYLPILYGSDGDFDLLYRTKELVLVEGVFDRIAMKRVCPEMAVFARLSKGIGPLLETFIRRFATRVWLAFDNDPAGKLGTGKAQKRLGSGVETAVLSFPINDPAALLKKYGLLRSKEIINRQMDNALWLV